MKLLLTTCIFSSFFALALAGCKNADLYHDGFCYEVPVFGDSDGMTHPVAQQYCQQFGGTLSVFHTAEQESFVVNMGIKIFGKGYGWIGMTNGKWDDGSTINYQNWDKGYPTKKSNCVMEYFNNKQNNDGKWRDDYPCDTKAKFLCQYRATPEASTSPSCTSSDFVAGTRCYTFSTARATRPDAVKNCAAQGKTLAIFDDFAQLTKVNAKAVNKFKKFENFDPWFWIGLYRSSVDFKFYWPGDIPMSFTNWEAGAPMNLYPGVAQHTKNGQWVSAVSDLDLSSFVCSGVL